MPSSFSFDFGHRFIRLRDWPTAFLVFTETNVFTPDPSALVVDERPDGVRISATRLAWAGLQQSAPGSFSADVRFIEGGFDCAIAATMSERVKGTALLLR